jgi:hypothetical protein
MNERDVIELLRREVAKAGSGAAWARRHDFSRAYISDLLTGKSGKSEIGACLLDALGLEVTSRRKIRSAPKQRSGLGFASGISKKAGKLLSSAFRLFGVGRRTQFRPFPDRHVTKFTGRLSQTRGDLCHGCTKADRKVSSWCLPGPGDFGRIVGRLIGARWRWRFWPAVEIR